MDEPEKLTVRKNGVEWLRGRLLELNNLPDNQMGDPFIAGERAGIEIALRVLDLQEEDEP